MQSLTPRRALVTGTLTIAVMEGVLAMARARIDGTPPWRVLQGVASGAMGQPAFRGGLATVLFGLALHLLISLIVMLVYLGASRRIPGLSRRPWLSGVIYGVAVYAVMNLVVLPLSAVSMNRRTLARVLPALAIHIVGVGLPAALIARRIGEPQDAGQARAAA
jgi:hypothetical protein